MLSGVLAHPARTADDRGASMVVAMAAALIVLGFGAVVLQLVRDDLSVVDRRLGVDEATLHAEFAASEGVARVVDGQEGIYTGAGTVDGDDYGYTVTPNGDETWTIVGRAGDGSQERIVTTVIRRQTTGTAPEPDRYAAYAEDLFDIGWVRGGDIEGPIGAGDRVKYWYSHSVASRQDYVNRCENCPNPLQITSYETLPLPDPTGAAPCPADGSYRLTGPVTLSGAYDCSTGWRTLRISGTIDISGPVVIHVGNNTRLDIRNATINDGGDSADFVIAKATTSNWAYRGVVDDTTLYGRILAPESYIYVGDVTWRGTFEVGTWWLYDWATIDGAWDGDAGGTGQITEWLIDSWQLS